MLSKMIYNNKDRLLAGMIVAGLDPYEGAQIYNISLGGALIPEDWTISGSGSGFIYGYCDANYRPNFSYEEAEKFCLAGKFIYSISNDWLTLTKLSDWLQAVTRLPEVLQELSILLKTDSRESSSNTKICHSRKALRARLRASTSRRAYEEFSQKRIRI